MAEPTLKEQLTEVKREIHQRERVYPRWVADNKMTQALADRQTERMKAVAATLERLIANEPQEQTSLSL